MWQIVEAHSFPVSVASLGTAEDIDCALQNVDFALYRNPLGFSIVPGTRTIRLAKTKLRISGLQVVPAYRLWFRVDIENRIVTKLYVELCPVAEMDCSYSSDDDL